MDAGACMLFPLANAEQDLDLAPPWAASSAAV
jgi:hypothetical protein